MASQLLVLMSQFFLFVTLCSGLSVISADVCFVCSSLHVMASQLLVLMSVLSVHYFMEWAQL